MQLEHVYKEIMGIIVHIKVYMYISGYSSIASPAHGALVGRLGWVD